MAMVGRRTPAWTRGAPLLARSALLPVLVPVLLLLVLVLGAGTVLEAQEPAREEVIALQAALEAKGFSPGLIDGIAGPKTDIAIRALQGSLGLPETGRVEEALGILGTTAVDAVTSYRIRKEDAAEVEHCPPDWNERSRREKLLYGSLSSLVAEKFHTSERCLLHLNPGRDLAALAPGDEVRVPNLKEREKTALVERLEIDLSRRLILVLAPGGKLVGLVHCSVARDLTIAARGTLEVSTIVEDPGYTFDPRKWPEVAGVDRKLSIPPGPRSPVGLRWIGLDSPGVGIHGTPEPENIGKTGSHGCFRLTNWDAVHLASIVRVGTRVSIVDGSRIADRIERRG